MTEALDPTACTILLVDDEGANLDLLEVLLRPRGYGRLVRVSDARECVAAFDRARPDLVLLDLHMPHLDGFAVLDALRARTPPDEFLPVLVLTADVTPRARERALAGGAHDFLTKPFDRVEVLLRVRNLLHTRLLHLAQRQARAAAERAAAHERLLADASRLLAASLDQSTALAQLAGRLAPDLADRCVVVRAADAPEPADGLALPVGDGDDPTWLVLERDAGRGAFDDAERALAAELARRAREALERARLLQATREAVAARDRVLAIVAHDLRGPLTAVRFDVEMMQAEPPGDAATLGRVARATARMDRLIEDLLDVARLGQDALALDRRPTDPGKLMAEAADMLRPLVEGAGHRFEVRGEPSLPETSLDATRLLQAVSNLVGNAAKFARPSGRVTLAWDLATPGEGPREPRELRIAVRDDGPGIPPEQLQHIFGAFWQARHADRRGLGLGLAIARAVAEAHGGRIWVESAVGEGSTFVLAIPVAPAA